MTSEMIFKGFIEVSGASCDDWKPFQFKKIKKAVWVQAWNGVEKTVWCSFELIQVV